MEILESITSSPLFSLGSFILGAVGILLTVFLYFRSQKNKIPCYKAVSHTIIERLHNSLDDLEVHYKGSVQKRITVTRIVFWNAGKETINKIDTVEKDPLRVEVPAFIEVLDIQVIDVSSDSNSVSMKKSIISEDKTVYPLDFDYFDHNEYFVIQIIHNASSEEKLGFEGKIKGVQSFGSTQSFSKETIPFIAPTRESVGNQMFTKYFMPFIFFAMGIFVLWRLLNGKTDWYVWLIAVFFFFIAVITYYNSRYAAPAKL